MLVTEHLFLTRKFVDGLRIAHKLKENKESKTMRKIEQEMIEAIKQWKNYRKDNTRVEVDEDISGLIYVFLHNHRIASIDFSDNTITLRDARFQTKTTKSRLNAILSHFDLPNIYSKKFQWYIGNEEWYGSKFFEINN